MKPRVGEIRSADSVDKAKDASRRHVMRRAATVGLMMRHCATVVVATVNLLSPPSEALSAGKWVLGALGCWSMYRIATRSQSAWFTAIDYGCVLVVCISIPLITSAPDFHLRDSAPAAITGTAVVSFSVMLPARVALPMAAGVVATYALGAGALLGWHSAWGVTALYYFALQWLIPALIRITVLRIATAVDSVRDDRVIAETNRQVTQAVREFAREQLALLHDTAASTLLMVGLGTPLPRDRLAAQARRDLALLDEGPWVAPPARTELVERLRDIAAQANTASRFCGLKQLWLDGEAAKAVLAAAREVLNNVDRHAGAALVSIEIRPDRIVFIDTGIGFVVDARPSGHGIAESIIGRMSRAGGTAWVKSQPGHGTVVELGWATGEARRAAGSPTDPDRLAERIRVGFGMGVILVALEVVTVTFPYSLRTTHPLAQFALAVVAALAALAAVPGIRWGRWAPSKAAAVALVVVTIAQPVLLKPDEVGGQANWALGAIGWCVIPLVLKLRTSRAAMALLSYWVLTAVVNVVHDPSVSTLISLGLGSASLFGVQLFALLFAGLVRDAAADVHVETTRYQRELTRERVAKALREEYESRYARQVHAVMPLLTALGRGVPIDDELQAQARAESRRLRALFDQASTFDHPLLQKLRLIVDEAEGRQVEVALQVSGALPDLTAAQVGAVAAPVRRILQHAAGSARIVVTGVAEEVSVSVLCEGVRGELGSLKDSSGDTEVVMTGDSLWAIVRSTAEARAAQSILAKASR